MKYIIVEKFYIIIKRKYMNNYLFFKERESKYFIFFYG